MLAGVAPLGRCWHELWMRNNSKYDPENSGFISTERFRDLLAAHGSELDPHKLEVLLALADGNADGKICYQDFVNLVSSADELELYHGALTVKNVAVISQFVCVLSKSHIV
ncbi:rhomboid-related 3 isoform X1 [Labeo rohita]|uniref:rhomboid protease n=1 Tax=Labeo rohita TaxID=84645 RepID=A0A498MAR1_LABRO|nr:rhomboid-related 3 isoform X1 [Labeo rohita]